MSAQPVHDFEDPHDPLVILRSLPERARGIFRDEYRAAVDAARNPAHYPALRTLLQEWSTRAVSYSSPGFFEAAQDSLAGRGDNEPAEDTPPPDKAPAVWEDPDTRDFPGCRVCLGAGRVVSIGAGGMVESPCPRCAPDSAFRTG